MVDQFKMALRRQCRQRRAALSLADQQKLSAQVCARIQVLEQYRTATRIAVYHAIDGEVRLEGLWGSAAQQEKFYYFPVLNEDKTLSFLPVTSGTPFTKNRYGIAEPEVERTQALPPNQLDIVFMPLVAFDEKGTRLGMGAGYYDRTLESVRHPLLIGVAYEFQRQGFIEPCPWDIPLTAIVTEQTIYWSQL